MKSTTIIRGRPIYLYKGSQYLEMPSKCYVRKVVYDEESNTSKVYCKKYSHAAEIICGVVIISCVLLNILVLHHFAYNIRYTNLATYYNGELFINVYNDNPVPISISLTIDDTEVYEQVVRPYDYVIAVPVEDVNGKINLTFTVHRFLNSVSDEVTITAIPK